MIAGLALVRRERIHIFNTFRCLSSTAAESQAVMKLNFCLPHKPIYVDATVDSVIIPGVAGVYGVTQGHSPIISELQPGVVKIIHEEGKDPESWFVSAGFALTHPNSVTDITAVEAVPLSDIDAEAVRETFNKARDMFNAAPEGKEKASAQVMMTTAQAMGTALGVTLTA